MSGGNDGRYWWIFVSGKAEGPFSAELIAGRLRSGEISHDTMVAQVGETSWRPLGTVSQFTGHGLPPRPPTAPASTHAAQGPPSAPTSGKSESAVPAKGGPAANFIQFPCPNCKAILRAPDRYAGKRAQCHTCKKEVIVPAANDTGIAGSFGDIQKPATPSSPRPAGPPNTIGRPSTAFVKPEDAVPNTSYDSLPWFRKSSYMSILTVLALLTMCLGIGGLFVLPVCIVLATGDVYYRARSSDGSLKRWSRANRVAAYVVLAINAVSLFLLLRGRLF